MFVPRSYMPTRISPEETLEVNGFGDYIADGVSHADLSGMTLNVTCTHLNDKEHIFDMDLGKGDRITVKTFKDWVSVNVQGISVDS